MKIPEFVNHWGRFDAMFALLVFFTALLGHAFYIHRQTQKHLHHFQQCSYRIDRYWRWWKKKGIPAFAGMTSPPAKAINSPAGMIHKLAGIAGRLSIPRSSPPTKKPLVMTPRATRLYAINAGLWIVLYTSTTLAFVHGGVIPWILLIAFSLISSLPMIISALLLAPVERAINQHYFREAEQYCKSLPSLIKIGITGSYGKTSTKHLVASLLGSQFLTLMTPESHNTPMGITRIIREKLKPTHEVFVVEMGAREPGDIRELCSLVHPTIGILTAIGEQHLETFHSIETIIRTKFELIEALPPNGMALINVDNLRCRALADELVSSPRKRGSPPLTVIRYGVESSDADYQAVDILLTEAETAFTVIDRRQRRQQRFQTRLLGKHNVLNLTASIALACELGIALETLVPGVRAITPVQHRLERYVQNDITFIDDSYNSNPVGAAEALEVLKRSPGHQKILITPGMIELGSQEAVCNQRFGEQAAAVCDWIILVGAKQTLPIRRGIEAQGFPRDRLLIARHLVEAKEHLSIMAGPHDVVLFENDLLDLYDVT